MTTVKITKVNSGDRAGYYLTISNKDMGRIGTKQAEEFIAKYPHVTPNHSINMHPSFSVWHFMNP